jgi:hypothetical protein
MESSQWDREGAAAAVNANMAEIARAAIEAAEHRAIHAFDPESLYIASVEAVWWISMLDERVREQLGERGRKHPGPYARARNADPDGACVAGSLYARDRHTHQMADSIAEDDRPFFAAPGSSAVLNIASSGWVWRPSIELPASDSGRVYEHERIAYDSALAREDPPVTIRRALSWLERLSTQGA